MVGQPGAVGLAVDDDGAVGQRGAALTELVLGEGVHGVEAEAEQRPDPGLDGLGPGVESAARARTQPSKSSTVRRTAGGRGLEKLS